VESRLRGRGVTGGRRGRYPARRTAAQKECRKNNAVTEPLLLCHMEVKPRPKPPLPQEQRSNNTVTALLQAPGTAAAAGRKVAEGPLPDACRGAAALHRPGPVVQAPAAAALPPGDQAAHREPAGRGRGATGRPRERCESSPTPARPIKTCTLQDLGPGPALPAVPAGDRYRACRVPGRVVRDGKGSIRTQTGR
jgi:hypothetical protein